MNKPHPILATVFIYNNLIEAEMAKHLLEAEGIQCFLENENMNSLYANTIGGINLKVPGSELERAKEVLKKKS